jgi:DNA repair protein RecN (Recombination protein N)
MLRRLQIESYGLIESADVEFADGATIFTGETGSGKTMLLGALDFALGARAGADVVGRDAKKALVTVTFDPDEPLRARLASEGFELDRGEDATVVREMTDAGRSLLRVNGRPSTAAQLRDLREAIAEMIGQHEAQRLLSAAYHLELLDRFAGEPALRQREAVASAYAKAEDLAAARHRLAQDEARLRERYDDATFAVREIEAARLEPGEAQRLDERRGYLENVERIATALHGAHEALAAEEIGAVASLGAAAAALAGVAKYDAGLREIAQRVAALQGDAFEAAAQLSRALEAADYDPNELEAINARLDVIDRLKRKFGPTIDEVLAAAERARSLAQEYEGRDERIAQLDFELSAATRELRETAAALSAIRLRAAAQLSRRVMREFAEIALASGRLEVAVESLDRIAAHGAERVEFLFAADAGEPARPLGRVASGGELSRVLLAVVVVLAGARDGRAALVFDEIDAGIGGATATAVGARIGELARRGQVICVTHLAQLATWADRHYVLEKLERRRGSSIVVRPIATAKERVAEIARMLSGESHDVALRHARALLATARR